jgi:hypothetical protein
MEVVGRLSGIFLLCLVGLVPSSNPSRADIYHNQVPISPNQQRPVFNNMVYTQG